MYAATCSPSLASHSSPKSPAGTKQSRLKFAKLLTILSRSYQSRLSITELLSSFPFIARSKQPGGSSGGDIAPSITRSKQSRILTRLLIRQQSRIFSRLLS
ncbi:hypothetical protein WJX73_002219 [Symbiochloris irregularis]|uniref:Uncharacterized protein n=1 Tax=Symbiochloris irregularis TaxID=706552 RepID=A0AAW1PYM9_9CHLO